MEPTNTRAGDVWPEMTDSLNEFIPFRGHYTRRILALRAIASIDRKATPALREVNAVEAADYLHPLLILSTEEDVVALELRHRNPVPLSLV